MERFETHGNLVFLAGSDAWKIKRAVRFPYMDFSTLEKRRKVACAREVEVNRRLAPDIYLGCVAITRAGGGSLAFGGGGEVVEWAVHMRRFDQSALLEQHRLGEGRSGPTWREPSRMRCWTAIAGPLPPALPAAPRKSACSRRRCRIRWRA